MARVELAPEVADDVEPILDRLEQRDAANPHLRIQQIIAAIDVLEQNPLIGRPISNAMRELVIGADTHGYVALYSYLPEVDIVFVLAIRGQREAGYHI